MSADPQTLEPGPSAELDPIPLRIVIDGPSGAGKTTTAHALGASFARPVVTPEEEDGRTLLFDWMDHTGGRSDSRAIRTQVVAVPGHIPTLRVRLLLTADVVLFVADTTTAGLDDSVAALDQVRHLLATMAEPRPSLIVQANKRDQDDVVPLPEVRARLGVVDDDLLIETVATTGDGVRQSYIYAIRRGLERAREHTGRRVAEDQQTPEDLHAALVAPDPPAAPEEEPVAALEEPVAPVAEEEPEAIDAAPPVADVAPAPVPAIDYPGPPAAPPPPAEPAIPAVVREPVVPVPSSASPATQVVDGPAPPEVEADVEGAEGEPPPRRSWWRRVFGQPGD